MFCDVSNIVLNSKLLIVSGAPISVTEFWKINHLGAFEICDRVCENRACGLLKIDYFSNFWLS